MTPTVKHLPTLYNPFLNSIFNNPNAHKAPFKNIIQELAKNHQQYTLLIPDSYVLNEYLDVEHNPLWELCYSNEDFLTSHIIKSSVVLSSTVSPISKQTSVIYNTMNGKQVLIKNKMIYTGKGFKRSLKLRIVGSVVYFNSFCDYLPKGGKFMVIYIENNPDSETTYNLINHIISIFPGIDLNKLVYEYVELNLYDVLWGQLIYQFNQVNDNFDQEAIKVFSKEKYDSLSCLSLNQLDLPIDKPWELNELYSRISLAVETFQKLSDSMISTNKIKVVYDTVKILTEGSSSIVINADTLIGLLIMVIVHSKLDNLEAHLYYIKNFNSDNSKKNGQFNYIISNLDAVLYHIQSKDQGDVLVQHSSRNHELWQAIQDQDIDKLRQITTNSNESQLEPNHWLYSKNIKGEGCLTMAIKTNNIEIFQMLLIENPNWFSIDDILFERNVVTNQTLLMSGLLEECDLKILELLIDVILDNCQLDEQLNYFNYQDNLGRSIGHYIFHNYQLIDKIGHLINWELKDDNGRTPLFNLCRCYDHPDYPGLITSAFNCVYHQKSTTTTRLFNFDIHMDKSGNTLLHVILKGISPLLLTGDFELLDINQTNQKSLTPLMVYVKYNRLENLKDLLSDPRLDFLYEDIKNHYNVFDYLSFSAIKSNSESFQQIESCIFEQYVKNSFPSTADNKLVAMNGKYDSNNKQWLIFLKNNQGYSNYKSITHIKQILYLTKLKYPSSTFLDILFGNNFNMDISVTTMFHKYRINRVIDQLNVLFTSLVYQENIDLSQFYKSFLTVESKSSIFDLKQKILTKIEQKKKSREEVRYTGTKIDQIEFFLQYSNTDLIQYRRTIDRLVKLIAIGDIKLNDIVEVTNTGLNMLIGKCVDCEQFYSWKKLFDYIIWILFICEELIKNIDKLLFDIKSWKELYHSIGIINLELTKLEKFNKQQITASPPVNGTSTSRRNSNSSSSSSISYDVNDTIPDTIQEDDSFFNLGFGDSKKTRYKKLLMTKVDKVEQIMKLNVEINYNYEIVAFEISNFMKFKTEFLRFTMKQFVKDELVRLKHYNVQLTKVLIDLKQQPKKRCT
ncbi:hypothetical protein JA1_000577 [Spathaspora sp. JA1]|nr:hypothetical protein JA1_000577 [Spathaspora sp. JA1]